jgi:hypothetical protein
MESLERYQGPTPDLAGRDVHLREAPLCIFLNRISLGVQSDAGAEMRPIIQRWTPEDDERLKALAAQGASSVKAAAALKRRQSIVRERANKLGCPLPTLKASRQKWAETPNNKWRDY